MKNIFLIFIISFFLFFTGITEVNGATCVYNWEGTLTLTVTLKGSSISVDYEKSSIANSNIYEIVYSSLSASDFKNSSGEFDCSLVPNLYYNYNSELLNAANVYSIVYKDTITLSINETTEYNRSNITLISSESTIPTTSSSTDSSSDDSSNESTAVVNQQSVSELCQSENYQKVAKTIGWFVGFIKIIIPLVLLGIGIFEFYKAIVSSDEKTLKKAAMKFIQKIAAAVIIFLLPSLIVLVLSFIDDWNDHATDYEACTKCIFQSNDC